MDLVPHFATNVHEAFTKTPGAEFHHMDIVVVVFMVFSVLFNVVVVLGLGDVMFIVSVDMESVSSPNRILTP